VAIAVVAALLVAPAASAQTKWVRGIVASVGADTVTLKVGDKDMTFKVEKDTELIARGAGAASREAEKMGQPGVKFTDFVKVGEGLEVHYKEAGGTMTATEIRPRVNVPKEGVAPAERTGGSAKGTVSAVTGNSITVKGDKEYQFTVTPKTTVIGTGVGTKTRELKEKGQAATVRDLVGMGDMVIVSYREPGMEAIEIRIAMKGK
jgi:hypothetical protein